MTREEYMKLPICQSCGMPMQSPEQYGKHADGSANPVEGRTRLSRSARAKFGRRYGRAPGDEGVDW